MWSLNRPFKQYDISRRVGLPTMYSYITLNLEPHTLSSIKTGAKLFFYLF
jgi:hypothetical protein